MTEWFLNDSKYLFASLICNATPFSSGQGQSLCLQIMKYIKHGVNLNFKWMWLLWKSALKGFHFFTALLYTYIYIIYVYILRNYGVSIKLYSG